jgi:hypothetical protein
VIILPSNLGREEKRKELSAEAQDRDVVVVTEMETETTTVLGEITENSEEDNVEEDAIEMIDVD